MVTGGGGFLGTNLAAAALERGLDVMALDNLSRIGSRANRDWLLSQGSPHFVEADVRDADALAEAVRSFRPTCVFHVAGQVAMTTSIDNPRLDFEINALGTINLLEALRQHCPQAHVIYSSTNKVYGELEQFHYLEKGLRYVCIEKPQGFGEDVPIDPRSPYGCSKCAAEQYVLDYSRVFGMRTTGTAAFIDVRRATVRDVRSGLDRMVRAASDGAAGQPLRSRLYHCGQRQTGSRRTVCRRHG